MISINTLLFITACWTSFNVYGAPEPQPSQEYGLMFRKIDEEEAVRLQMEVPCIDRRENHGYEGLIEMSTVFVDKSLMIKAFLDVKEKVLVMHLPPLWTKTTIASMLRYFFQIRVSRRTNKVISHTNASNYKFFTEGVLLKAHDSPLQSISSAQRYIFGLGSEEEEPQMQASYERSPFISKHRNIMDEYLAQYPVIFMELWAGDEYHYPATIRKFLMSKISQTFRQFSFIEGMLNNTLADQKIDEKQRRMYEEYAEKFRVLSNTFAYYTNETYLEESLVFLSEVLYKLFNKHVIILVDEYAHIFDYYSYNEGPYSDEMKRRFEPAIKKDIALYRRFLWKTFNENPYLKKALLTGILSNTTNHLLNGYEDTNICTGNDNDIFEYFGLKKEEVKLLFDVFNVPRDYVDEAFLFYEDCAISKRNSDQVVYNTFSIVTYVHFQQIRDNWASFVNTKRVVYWVDIYDPVRANAFHRANFPE